MDSQSIADALLSRLAAEGTDHYDTTLNLIPAINQACQYTLAMIRLGYGQNKFPEEALAKMSFAKVFIPSTLSRVNVYGPASGIAPEIVTAVHVGGSVYPSIQVPALTNPVVSQATGYKYAGDGDPAKRMTLEESGIARTNTFAAGFNGTVPAGAVRYGYVPPTNYSTGTEREIQISPSAYGKWVTVFYVNGYTPITTLGTNDIPFMDSLYSFVLEKANEYINYPMEDGIPEIQVNLSEMNLLLRSLL